MRIAFAANPAIGHLLPLLPLATAARDAGHEVVVLGGASLHRMIEATGLRHVEAGPPELQAAFAATPERVGRTGEALAEATWTGSFARVIAGPMASGADALFGEWRPDLLVHEDSEMGSWIAAEVRGVPHVSLQATAWRARMQDVMRAPLGRLREAHGLVPDPELRRLHAYGYLATRPAALRDPRQPMPETTRPIRPVAMDEIAPDATAWAPPAVHARPLVGVTLGTMVAAQVTAFEAVLAGLAGLDVDVVMTVGHAIDPAALGRPPANVRIERYIPMSRLLPSCDLLVFHGGSGTMLAALAAGLPLVILPTAADQPENAARCREAGVAAVVGEEARTPAAIRHAIEDVLSGDRYRAAAAAVRREIEAMPAPAAVLPELERLAAAGSR